jgi:hypothetical protein
MLYCPHMETLIIRSHWWLKRHPLVRGFVIVVLILLCALEFQAIVDGFRNTYFAEDLYLNYRHGQVVRERDTLLPEEIEPWMTFQYLNFVFKLPPEYLEDALRIDAKQYPNIQITRYARMRGLPLDLYLEMVKDKVAGYVPARF